METPKSFPLILGNPKPQIKHYITPQTPWKGTPEFGKAYTPYKHYMTP